MLRSVTRYLALGVVVSLGACADYDSKLGATENAIIVVDAVTTCGSPDSAPPPPDAYIPPPPDAPADQGCTLTQGFWKTHPEAWPVASLSIGGTSYSKAELLAILNLSTRGDVSIILAHQLIAAMLNALSGATTTDVDAAFAHAQTWMANNKDADGRLPYGVKTSDAATGLATALDDFNNGVSGPGHCDD